jgi:hypothetical protein
MIVVLTALVVLLALAVAAAAGLGALRGVRLERQRARVRAEQQLAEWQLQRVAREAVSRMLAEARQARGKS